MARPPLSDPAMLLATVGGVGLMPWAPGTSGSLVGVGLAWLVSTHFGAGALAALCAVLFLVGWWASERVVRASGVADPSYVVIDEVVGQGLVLATVAPTVERYAAGFLLFRLFDILKPWPVSGVERRFRNGFGIMADDALAAAYAWLILYVSLKYFRY